MKKSTLFVVQVAAPIMVLFPYIVGFTPNSTDSSTTSVELAIGSGSYAHVSRDCEGKVLGVTDVPFQDAAASVDYETSPVRVGVKAGGIHTAEDKDYQGYKRHDEGTIFYANPNVGLNTSYVGLDAGVLLFNRDRGIGAFDNLPIWTGRIRLGKLNRWYVSTSFDNNMPLFSGGGMIDAGIGFHGEKAHSNFWIGLGALPYDGAALCVRGDIPTSENMVLNLRGLFAPSQSDTGYQSAGKLCSEDIRFSILSKSPFLFFGKRILVVLFTAQH